MPTRLAIEVRDVVKTFGAKRAVDGVSFAVQDGEIVALVGPSGSGKTTLLRVIAGFERPDDGTITIGGQPVAGAREWVEPERRRVGMVFQEGALFPHLSVAGNVAFGKPKSGADTECLALVGLADRASAYPHELSGGERQRVALARALAVEPSVVLMDEPFASLDAGLRETLRDEVSAILRTAGASALVVTHNQEEALSLADRVVVMHEGRIEQVGTPAEVYNHPATRWVAEFLGGAAVLAATVSADGTIVCELGPIAAPTTARGDLEIVVRPESIALHRPDDAANPPGAPLGTVVGRSFHGHELLVRLVLPSGQSLQSRCSGSAGWQLGDELCASIIGPIEVLTPPDEKPTDTRTESPHRRAIETEPSPRP